MNVINKKEDKIVFLTCTAFTILCMLPFYSALTYAMDDYHLLNLYDINAASMGYNFYSTGRLAEAVLAQFLYDFNLQPFGKPIGLLIFTISLVLSGTYLSDVFDIRGLSNKIIVCLLFVLNPFFIEIYYYSYISIYSGFAILFLFVGFKMAAKYCNTKKKRYIILTIVFYFLSLSTYQIFYPIVGFILIIYFLINIICKKNENIKVGFLYHIIFYVASFIIFYVILKIMFTIWPPIIVYDGIDIMAFFKGILSGDYWILLVNTIYKFLFTKNIFNSPLALILLNGLALISFLYNIIKNKFIKHSIISLGIVILYGFLGPVACLGFGLSNLNSISGRSLTAFGIYETGLFVIAYYFLNQGALNAANDKVRKFILLLSLLVVFVNGGLAGRAAMNTIRLNNLENNLANRIVYRMEQFPEFTNNSAVIIIGIPATGTLADKGLGDFDFPALASFSKIILLNEVTGYQFTQPTEEQYQKAMAEIEHMETWPSAESVKYVNDCFIVRLHY